MIEIRDLSLVIKGRSILELLFLDLETGKRYGLIGENGSGKTTFLRLMAGTIEPTTGTISGIKRDEKLAYLPQTPYAFSFSVLENVKMAFPTEEEAELAMAALDKVAMSSLAKSRGDRLSGGEKQRMSLARLLALPRNTLLLDEPTSATDIRGTDLIEGLLLDWQTRSAGTLIFSTHSPAQALRMADEILFLEAGKLIERASAKELIENPQCEQTRAFLSHWQI